jgi:hypothetical protein
VRSAPLVGWLRACGDFGADRQFQMPTARRVPNSVTGRMAPNASQNFVALGTSTISSN